MHIYGLFFSFRPLTLSISISLAAFRLWHSRRYLYKWHPKWAMPKGGRGPCPKHYAEKAKFTFMGSLWDDVLPPRYWLKIHVLKFEQRKLKKSHRKNSTFSFNPCFCFSIFVKNIIIVVPSNEIMLTLKAAKYDPTLLALKKKVS